MNDNAAPPQDDAAQPQDRARIDLSDSDGVPAPTARALRLTRWGLWWEASIRAFWPLLTLVGCGVAALSLGLVEAGLGVSVLPRLATPSEDHPILVTRPLENPRINRTIGVVRRQGAHLSPPADRFLSLLLDMWS